MQAHRLPAARGWAWIREGFRLFLRSPPLVTFLAFSWLLLVLGLNLFPLIGQILAAFVLPALCVGVGNGCRALDKGQPVAIGVVLSGFRENRRTLLWLGAIYFIAGTGAVMLGLLAVGDLWPQLVDHVAKDEQIPRELLSDPRWLVPFGLLGVVFHVIWFASLVAAWGGHGPAKSLFFSLVGFMRNVLPFVVYSLGIVLVGSFLPGLVIGAVAAVSQVLAGVLSFVAFVALMFVFFPVVFASMYVSARDIFNDFQSASADA